jgi:hypothetical protein
MSRLEVKHSVHWSAKGGEWHRVCQMKKQSKKRKKTITTARNVTAVCCAMLQTVAYKTHLWLELVVQHPIKWWVCNMIYSNEAELLLPSNVVCVFCEWSHCSIVWTRIRGDVEYRVESHV